jgi:glycopeptide antibiotics resistance protein
LAVVTVAFALYVSLLPFRLQAVPLDAAWDDFLLAMSSWPQRVPRVNFLANVLLFVPVGFGLCGAWRADRQPRLTLGALFVVLSASVAASLAAEFLQEFAPRRVVSASDVLAQTIGCWVGIAAWLGVGPELIHRIRETRRQTHHDLVTRGLVAYAAIWAFANLAPFDITLNVDRLANRWRDGEIVLIPFASNLPLARLWWDAVVTAVSAVPLGALLLVGWQPRGQRRSVAAVMGIGVTALVTLEIAQIFIRSHGSDMTDVVCGAVGVALGVLVGVRMFDRRLDAPAGDTLARWAWIGLGAWCLMLGAYHWQPFDFGVDESLVRQKLARISLIPLAGYRSGSDLNAFNTLLAKIGLAIPFGGITSFALGGLAARPIPFVLVWVSLSAAVFGAIEVGQFFLPSRFPDPSDVWLGIAGSGLGIWLVRWLRSGYKAPRPLQGR